MDMLSPKASKEEVQKFIQAYEQSIKTVKTDPKTTFEYEGHIFSRYVSAENIQYLRTWKIPENSVVVCGHPKTGNVWCTEIVRNVLYIKDEEHFQQAKDIPITMLFVEGPPRAKFDYYEQLEIPRRFLITHLPEELFSFKNMKQANSKMVYVIRNPKDQLVSWFHFSIKMAYEEEYRKSLGENWSDFFENFIKGEHPLRLRKGEWYPDHIRGWLKHRNDKSFLIVEYEALKKDFHNELKRIAEFLEVDLTEKEVERVAVNCSFGNMKKAATADESEFLGNNIHKGEVGRWKEQFTVAQSELMDKLIDEKLGDSGIKFTYVL